MTGAGTAKGTLFTPESANRALPYVRAVVEDLVDACARKKAAEGERRRARAKGAGKSAESSRDEAARRAEDAHEKATSDISRLLRELQKAGIEVKDDATGLVDFPGEIGGRRVLLCWRRGEDRVAFWHDEASGFRGRKPIEPADAGSP
jgi:hypothetical protein